mgnify:CR=1 FL=1
MHLINNIVLSGLFLLGQSVSAQNDPMGLLPIGPGQEETYYACASCHSIKLVVQQGMDKAGWKETIQWMVDEQEMEPLPVDEEAIIIKYLAKYFGTDRPNKPTYGN